MCASRRHPALADVLALARRQHGVVTRRQLLDAGLSRRGIDHRLKRGRLHRIHPSVYAVGRPELTREGRWLAAVLACGPGAVLSHLCAATLWGIWERAVPAQPQVSVPGESGRRGPRGIELHRASTLAPDDTTIRDHIPVTTLPRTLLDLAAVLDAKRLRSALRQAERVHRLDLQRMRHSLDALPAAATNVARLKSAVDAYVPNASCTDSDLEATFLELCATHNLPAPEPQVAIGGYRADFMWPELNFAVEVDDRGSHDGYVAFAEDRRRDRAMKRAGVDVWRYTGIELTDTPWAMGRELKAEIARRTAQRISAGTR